MMKSIVVVDDSDDLRTLVAQLLRGEGYHVSEARNGREALQLLVDLHPKLVLLDVSMPEMSGLQVLSAARELPGFSMARFVLLSAMGDEATIQQARRLGACGYISKGRFEVDQLLEQVKVHFAALPEIESPHLSDDKDHSLHPPPFAIRLLASSQECTDWLSYRHVRFDGDDMHLELTCRYHLPFEAGERLTLETRHGQTQVTLRGLTQEGLLVLHLHERSNNRLSELFENSWD